MRYVGRDGSRPMFVSSSSVKLVKANIRSNNGLSDVIINEHLFIYLFEISSQPIDRIFASISKS